MASEDRSPPATLAARGPPTAKKRKSVKRIPFQDFNGEDDSLDQISQGSRWQVADAQAQPMVFNHEPVSLASEVAQDVEIYKRKKEGQGNRTSEREHARPLDNEAPMPSSQADHSVQVSATNGSVPQYMQQAGNQSMDTATSSLAQSQSSHSLSETHAMADSGHKLPEGPESDSWYATAREELQQDPNEGDRGCNSPVASPPRSQVQPPTPLITPAPLAKHLTSKPPGSSGTLTIPVGNGKGSSGIAAKQNTTGRGHTEASNHHLEVPSEASTRQNMTGAGKLAHSTDGLRTSSGRSLTDTTGQNATEPIYQPGQDQDSTVSSRPTIEQSVNSVGHHPSPDQAIGTSAGATSGQDITSTEEYANEVPTENIRPTPQNLRYGTYPSQQGPQNRNPPLGSGRLQNTTKLGAYKLKYPEILCGLLIVVELLGNGTTTWGLGAQTNGGYPRPSGVGTASFAQTIGGSQPNTSLDSEFPALGANSGQAQLGNNSSQAQYQNASPAIWANQRAIQQTPVQRPQQQQQQQHAVNPQPSQQHQQTQSAQDQSQRGNDDLFASTSHLQSVMDDNRYQSALGQMPISRQPPTTNADDYPPLGRNSADEIDDRRGNMLQNAGFGGFSNASAFSLPQEQSQSRNQPPSASSSQADTSRPSAGVDRLTSPNGIRFGATSGGRSPLEPIRQGHSGVQDHDRNNVNAIHGNQRNENTMNALLTNFGDSQFPPQQTATQPSHGQQEYGGRIGDPPVSARTPDRTPTSQMSAMDEFGLAGFLATVRSDNPDVAGLARGQDLTSLGLNLNSPEPLYPTFSGPFAEPGSRPFQPDFRLPECYTVDNVHRVRDKIPGFTEETLFWIFYTQPQDILQELAASELESRNWRFHKQHRMWLTKDPSLQEPVTLGPEKENGSYIFFNHTTWERIRLSNFDLHYNQLAPTSARPTGQ